MKAIERLYKYLSEKGISPNKFEKENGLSQGYLSKMYNRKADMGESILTSVLENCPDLRAEWLIVGKGEMLQEPPSENCSLRVNPPDSAFYKTLLEDKKEEIQNKDKEIARLNILVGRYEERITNFQTGNDTMLPHRGCVPLDYPEKPLGEASSMQELPIPPKDSATQLNDRQSRPEK